MFDESKFCIGKICKNAHIFLDSGGSLRYKSTRQCVECHKSWSKDYGELETSKERNRNQSKQYYWENREDILPKMSEYRKTNNFKLSCKKSYIKHKDVRLTDTKEWKEENKTHVSEYNKDYAKKHSSEISERARRYREVNRDIILAKAANYRKLNADKIKEQQRRYRQSEEGKLKRLMLQTKREALKKGVLHQPYTSIELKNRFSHFGDRCVYCDSNVNLTIDHFVAIALGGADALWNIVPACRKCNNCKWKKSALDWYPKQNFFKQDKLDELLRETKQV